MTSAAQQDMQHPLKMALEQCVGRSYVHTEQLDAWAKDGTELFALPDVVVEPATTDEVAAVVRVAAEYGVPVVTRGAGTGVAGGAVPQRGDIVLSTSRLNRIIEIDAQAMTATVGAGVRTGELQAAVEAEYLFYPPDPSSLAECTIGGNVACNAGGPRALKYGVTRQYVLGLTVVLANGNILRLGGKTHKQASGYALLHLFVGSEGTLGIVTEVTLRLIPLPPVRATLTALFPTLDEASHAVTAVLHSGSLPCTIELMDRTTLRAVEDYLHLGLPHEAGAMLIIEQDGISLPAIAAELEQVRAACEQYGGFEAAIATTEEERAQLWAARRSAYYALLHLAPMCRAEDIVVPRSAIPKMVEQIEAIAVETGLLIAVCGHAGDGNLHPLIAFDGRDPQQLSAVQRAEALIVQAALDLGGMVSGEHGVGTLKLPFLEAAVGTEAVAIMRMLKQTLDPQNILNPGKVIPAGG